MAARSSRATQRRGVGTAILFAVLALLVFVGASFAAGFIIGKLLL